MTIEPFGVAVFARAPVAGATKTRLIPAIGAERAARLHAHLIDWTLTACRQCAAARVTLFVHGDAQHPALVELAHRHAVPVNLQVGTDLGARMHSALVRLLDRFSRAMVIGTDNLNLSPDLLQSAADALEQADAVVQPALDGGYTLIGLKRPCAALFRDILWGTAEVLAATRARADDAGLRLQELPPTWDLDTPADLQRALNEGLLTKDSFSQD
jgi:rSAM/selenodomain-associated transferase 1